MGMILVTGITVVILSVISILHGYWAVGGFWPGKDEKSLILTVVGSGAKMPSPPLTWLVTAALGVAAILPLMATLEISGLFGSLIQWGLWGLVLVFAGRGISGFFEIKNRPTIVGTPYARLNVLMYSPLCLFLAVCFTYLAW